MTDHTAGQREPSATSRGCVAEPLAWAVVCGDAVDSTFTAREVAVEWACGLIPPGHIVPLYRHPPVAESETTHTITDAEREAVEQAAIRVEALCQRGSQRMAATLRGLLERLGGGQ